jgi:hypothetical protein
VWVATTTMESVCAMVVWESVLVLVREAEAQATLAEIEARERVSRMETGSAVVLASVRGESKGFAHWIALLKGELVDARQAQHTSEALSKFHRRGG